MVGAVPVCRVIPFKECGDKSGSDGKHGVGKPPWRSPAFYGSYFTPGLQDRTVCLRPHIGHSSKGRDEVCCWDAAVWL